MKKHGISSGALCSLYVDMTCFFKGITTLILASGSVLILIPFLYMISTSLKDPAQIRY